MGKRPKVRAALLGVVWAGALWGLGPAVAQAPRNVAERYLFAAANAERLQRGLPALRWDESLYGAASSHAREMAARASISHQYAGEPELAARAQEAGARFSEVAENVAEAPTATMIHRGWMESEHHRDNLLDPRLDRVAISVLERDGELYAVEDFDRDVAAVPYAEQEDAIASLLAASAAVSVQTGGEDARATCAMETGYAGARRPWFVMRFTASSLQELPEELLSRLATGKYRTARVGACPARSGRFASYNIAVLLYP